ncbi:MAG TPA: DNA starvation/stationary phase protection protein [Caldimonas sp.]|nr:DNA starvation/stationary phase protection protein [Caldimonas sp.]
MTKKVAKQLSARGAKERRKAPLDTPTDLTAQATRDIAAAMNGVLADVFALYLKTKNFHWHMSGPHFRDYHVLLDEQSDQIYAMTDPIAERVRKVGGSTLRSIGHIARMQRIADNDADYVEPSDMLAELREDNKSLASRLREAHNVCDKHRDIATSSLIEVWIDETERRTWFLFEAGRPQDATGR